MPSASSKPENKASAEATNVFAQAIIVIEKKIRNLEKRKGRLEAYREKEEKGQQLDRDQKDAVAKLGEVEQNLEFARELQKQYASMQTDFEKQEKKRMKQEQKDQHRRDVKRVEDVLRLQGLLDGMGSPEAREFFKSNESCKLSAENLDQLDQLYQLISPSHEGVTSEEYNSQLISASVHINNLLEGKDKSVVGTTFKGLKEIVDKIYASGYFDKSPKVEEESESGEKATSEAEKEDYIVVDAKDVPEAGSQELAASVPTIPQQMAPVSYEEEKSIPQQLEESQFYSQTQEQVLKEQRTKSLSEIIPNSDYNFLQDSELEEKAQQQANSVSHIDPAVVHAHPMAPPNLSAGDAFFSHNSRTDHSQFQAQPPTYRTEEYSQNFQTQSYNTLRDSPLGHQALAMDPTMGAAAEVPPAIPMPNQGGHGDTGMGPAKDAQWQEKVTPILNPEAAVFKMQQEAPVVSTQSFASTVTGPNMTNDKNTFSQGAFQNDYQDFSTTNQWSNNTNNRSYGSGSQNRSGGGRGGNGGNGGGPRGRGGMSNGYNRGGNRGGNSWNNGPRGGGSMGYNNRGSGPRGGSRGGPRGGSSRGGGPRGGNSYASRPGGNQVQASA